MRISAKNMVIPAKGKAIVPTDIAIAVPSGTYGRVAPRSGLAHKHFLDVGAGVIDEDYRGNVGIIMFNFSDKDFEGIFVFESETFTSFIMVIVQ
jgi:dUTP pyrophosphatase